MVGVGKTKKQKFRARENVPPRHLCKVKPKGKTSCMTVKYSASVYLHSLKSSKRCNADFTVGNIYFWLTIFRKDRVLLSCTVGPSFQNWIYEVMFNMFLSVEGVNPLLELEKRREVQRLMNNSWRKTKCINAARLAQLEEHWSAEREVVASNPSRTNNQSLQKTAWWDDAGCYLVTVLLSGSGHLLRCALQLNIQLGLIEPLTLIIAALYGMAWPKSLLRNFN